jgi:hypothetical protein
MQFKTLNLECRCTKNKIYSSQKLSYVKGCVYMNELDIRCHKQRKGDLFVCADHILLDEDYTVILNNSY